MSDCFGSRLIRIVVLAMMVTMMTMMTMTMMMMMMMKNMFNCLPPVLSPNWLQSVDQHQRSVV